VNPAQLAIRGARGQRLQGSKPCFVGLPWQTRCILNPTFGPNV
jgi:hypothetical protein